MNRDDFINSITRCLRKAFLDVTWHFSTDEDQDAKICLAADGHLILNYVQTAYCISNIEQVKYGIDRLNENYYISLFMNDGNILQIGTIRSTDYISLQTEKNDNIILYSHNRRRPFAPEPFQN